MMQYDNLPAANCGAQYSELCLLGMLEDSFVGMGYIIFIFHVAHLWMIVKFSSAFSCISCMRYVFIAGWMMSYDITGLQATELGSCKYA